MNPQSGARSDAMRTAVVLGTRPEIIKLSPVIRALRQKKRDFFVLHTGQHYSYNLDRVFFENLGLGTPEINLGVGSGSHAEETGKMMIGIEKALMKEGADGVLVEGDTNSVLAGALAAAKLHVRVGHVEAGLRSRDRRMPEELNRIVADHLSDILFPPTKQSKANLLKEGIDRSKIFVTGNTIVDAVNQNLELAMKAGHGSILGGGESDYMLATVHRQENVDDAGVMSNIILGLERIAKELGKPVIYPVHPRARNAMGRFGIKPDLSHLRLADPVDYLQFLRLERNASMVLTDSGGVQEEACIMGVPCVTLRDSTERPETVEVGANVVAGTRPDGILKAGLKMARKKGDWRNPFGDGKAASRIIRAWTP